MITSFYPSIVCILAFSVSLLNRYTYLAHGNAFHVDILMEYVRHLTVSWPHSALPLRWVLLASPERSPLPSCQIYICNFMNLHKFYGPQMREKVIIFFLDLTEFVSYDNLLIEQHNVVLYWGIKFHCVYMPPFLYWFPCWWTHRLIPRLDSWISSKFLFLKHVKITKLISLQFCRS